MKPQENSSATDNPSQETHTSNQQNDSQPLPQSNTQSPVAQPAMPMQPPQNIDSSSSSKNKLFVFGGLAIALLVIISLVSALLYLFILSPAAQAKKASTEFMNAASKGDSAKLIEIAGSDDSEQFLKNVAESLKGSYKLIDRDSKNDNYYFLYELSDAKSNFARTIVVRDDGKWMVDSIVFGDKKLILVPEDKPDESSSTNKELLKSIEVFDDEDSSPPPSTSSNTCLVNDDFRWMSYNDAVPTVDYVSPDTQGFITMNEQVMFFEADSITETSRDAYNYWAEFGTKNSDKNWKFVLKGSVYQASNSSNADPLSVKLANDRANAVKKELVSRGVPEEKIEVAQPFEHSDEYVPGFQAEIYRKTTLFIDNGCVTYPKTVLDRTYN